MSESVFIVICPELGWDNVVGVYDPDYVTFEELRDAFPEEYYIEHREVIGANRSV